MCTLESADASSAPIGAGSIPDRPSSDSRSTLERFPIGAGSIPDRPSTDIRSARGRFCGGSIEIIPQNQRPLSCTRFDRFDRLQFDRSQFDRFDRSQFDRLQFDRSQFDRFDRSQVCSSRAATTRRPPGCAQFTPKALHSSSLNLLEAVAHSV